jgi:N4-(beta-N-acetylglucosaminyl)-L-asparaginase
MIKRRTFLKWGALGTTLGLVRPAQAAQSFSALDTSVALPQPIIVSTWNHGLAANQEAWKVIEKGGKSIDAVEKGLRVTEADVTNRSVGIGGLPDRTGHVTLDACIMDERSRCGAVAFLEGIDHPVSVARRVMEDTQHVMLVGAGAHAFALEKGFGRIKTPVPEAKAAYKKWQKEQDEIAKHPLVNHENHDTIGMIAMDAAGNISGACTTSGWAYKLPGRVGDSPIIGAGLFIDNEVGGACATGLGEAIIRIAGSHTVVELMRQGYDPQEACKMAVDRILAKHDNLENLQCCFLAINKQGKVGAYSVYEGFNYALSGAGTHVMKDAPFNRKWAKKAE